jgi:hypothetical protein
MLEDLADLESTQLRAVDEIEQAKLQNKVDELLNEIEAPLSKVKQPIRQTSQWLFDKIKQYVMLNYYEKQASLQGPTAAIPVSIWPSVERVYELPDIAQVSTGVVDENRKKV